MSTTRPSFRFALGRIGVRAPTSERVVQGRARDAEVLSDPGLRDPVGDTAASLLDLLGTETPALVNAPRCLAFAMPHVDAPG